MTITNGRRSAATSPLALLLRDVVAARAVVAEERHASGSTSGSSSDARAGLLSALEAYTAALTTQRLPVPYALRDELRIRRRVCR